MFKGILSFFRKKKEVTPVYTPIASIPKPEIKHTLACLNAFIGQKKNISLLKDQIVGSAKNDKLCPHVLLFGDAGYGKTTLAKLIAEVYGTKFVHISGMNTFPKDIKNKLYMMSDNSVFFIDEVHALSSQSQEMLYEAMQDGTIDGMRINPFILVAATTRMGSLNKPFRDRFGIHLKMEDYSQVEIEDIVKYNSNGSKYRFDNEQDYHILEEIARRSKLIPRVALQIAKNVINRNDANIEEELATSFVSVVEQMGIERDGLDKRDIGYLEAIARSDRGSASIATIAACLSESPADIMSIEGYLIKHGYVTVTPRGRSLTVKGKERIGNNVHE